MPKSYESHHTEPRSQLGSNDKSHLSRVDEDLHVLWHKAVDNRTPDQIAVQLLLHGVRKNGRMAPLSVVRDGLRLLRPKMQRTLVNPDAILKEQKCQNGEYPQKYAIAAVERETYAQMEQVATMDAIRRLVSRSSNESNFPNRDMIRGLQNLFRQSKSALVLHKLLTERDTVDDPRWVKSWQPHKSEELTELTCGAIDEELSPSNRKRLLTFLHDEMPDLTIRCTHEWIPAHAEDLQILSSMSQEQYSRLLGNGDL